MGQSSTLPIIVTGAAGFIGARYVEHLNRARIPVISVDARDHFAERTEHRGLDFGTIVDREELFDWLAHEKPRVQAIVHMGACSHTAQLDEEFLRRVNVEYSQKVWDYCTHERIPLVYASSAATYGDGDLGYDDDESLIPRLKPLNPYGESKRLFDLWALEQERAGRTPPSWTGFKFFNVYGFGERHKGKMACSTVLHCFDQIQATGKMKLFASHREGIPDGEQKRDFIAVADVIRVMEWARSGAVRRGIYNLGTGQARSFLDLARAVFRSLGKPENIEFIPTPEILRPRYQYFTEAKMERLRKAGYTAQFTPLEDGVQAYIQRLLNP